MKNSSFIALSTPYYSFDPRAKIIFTLLVCILPFLPLSWMAQCTLTLISLLVSFTQIGWKNTMKNIKVILPIIILMTLLMPLQGRGGEALWSVNGRVIISVGSVLSWQRKPYTRPFGITPRRSMWRLKAWNHRSAISPKRKRKKSIKKRVKKVLTSSFGLGILSTTIKPSNSVGK